MGTSSKTLVLIKPDGLERGLAGEIISRFEAQDLKIAAARVIHIQPEIAKIHYKDHIEKDFYPHLEAFITRSPSMALILEGSGEDTVSRVREIMGATNPEEADAGTIRGDLAEDMTENLVHGSDSEESAEREIGIFFDLGI